MFSMLQNIFDQVRDHTTWLGQIWYTIFLVFRMIVMGGLGSAVYGDEQASFWCSTKMQGCQRMCFTEFAKLSHVRFWNFQLVAVASPIVFFHLYAYNLTKEAKDIEDHEKKLENRQEEGSESEIEQQRNTLVRRRKRIGKFEIQQINNEEKKVLRCRKIQIAYLICLFLQIVAEILFVFIGMSLFNIKNGISSNTSSLSDYLWMKIPGRFMCGHTQSPDVFTACRQHFSLSNENTVPCWVSRPWEKTILVRYMNIISVVCTTIAVIEFVYIGIKLIKNWRRGKKTDKPIEHILTGVETSL